MARTTAAGTNPSTGRPSARRARRSLDEMSRRGIVTRSTRQPGAGASACASPARSTITRVARSRVSSSLRHVGMFRTASAPSTRKRSRSGAASTSRVSYVTDGVPRSISIADASTPATRSTAAVTSASRSAADATTSPRFCHGSPATTMSTRSRPNAARVSTAATMWPTCTGSNVPPRTPTRSIRGVYERHEPFTVLERERHGRVLRSRRRPGRCLMPLDDPAPSPAGHFPDARLDALESAAALCEATTVDDLHATLTLQTRREFLADWSALVEGSRVLAHAGDGMPSADVLNALVTGTSASTLVAEGVAGPDDLAVASFTGYDAALLLGRVGHPLRRRERGQLLALVRIADRAWRLLADYNVDGAHDRHA